MSDAQRGELSSIRERELQPFHISDQSKSGNCSPGTQPPLKKRRSQIWRGLAFSMGSQRSAKTLDLDFPGSPLWRVQGNACPAKSLKKVTPRRASRFLGEISIGERPAASSFLVFTAAKAARAAAEPRPRGFSLRPCILWREGCGGDGRRAL